MSGGVAVGTRQVRRLHALLGVVIAAGVAFLALPGRAGAADGTWGPDRIAYVPGDVCESGARSAALVGWRTAADAHTAFAVRTVTGPPAGGVGAFDEPATVPTATAPGFAPGWTPAGLAYLLSTSGQSSDPNVVTAVAAAVAGDAAAADCLASGAAGAAVTAQQLRHDAAVRHGPYTVTVTPRAALVLGQPERVEVVVRSAAGVPMPGMTVRLASTTPGVFFPVSGAVTDASGRAEASVEVPSTSTATAVAVRATVSAPGSVLELSAPGDVPLLVPGPDVDNSSATTLPVDTTADPDVRVAATPSLVLPGTATSVAVSVSGLRGHAAHARLDAVGPLAFASGRGCSGYDAQAWADAAPEHTASVTEPFAVVGDRTVNVSIGEVRDAGCYLVRATVHTDNAIPAATAQSPVTTEAVVSAAPVHVSTSTPGHGVSAAGRIEAQVRASGDIPADIADVAGTVTGPVSARRGTCAAARGGAAVQSSVESSDSGPPALIATARGAGCYTFRVQTRLELPGLGSVTAPTAETRVLVVDPQLIVTGLGTTSAPVGGRIRAHVAVYGTLTQPGLLRLQLARLRDDSDGCFDQDYRDASVLAPGADAPHTSTTGDGTYDVTSPPVPTAGCWTVEPVLTLTANAAVRVVLDPGTRTTVAVTVVSPSDALDLRGPVDVVDSTARWVTTAVLTLLVLITAAVGAVVLAYRNQSPDDET